VAITCPGFRFAGIRAGIKNKADALDLGLIVPDGPAVGAAIFTSNRVPAAPVEVSKRALERGRGTVRAVVVNSGNANACTGARGMADARAMVAATAAAVGAPRGQVIVSSTGVIGVPLPIDRVTAGIDAASAALGRDFAPFARAILTTDRAPKTAKRTVTLGGERVTLIGCTKGAGMIAPNMATTLTFVCTDAAIPRGVLRRALAGAAAETFNAITVDGDTSTNDMLLVLAGGAAGPRAANARDVVAFRDALTSLCDDLARALMRGGEGVHHVVTIHVTGARSVGAARQVARSIANSPLVKTAIAGGDPNWGRFLSAAGNAGVPLQPNKLALWLGSVKVAAGGMAATGRNLEARAAAAMQRPEYSVRLDLGAGRAEARYRACDLSHEYVTINADYRT
jgi:glutamate N-acetyltransferase/amino-acid N-acetyltransferase